MDFESEYKIFIAHVNELIDENLTAKIWFTKKVAGNSLEENISMATWYLSKKSGTPINAPICDYKLASLWLNTFIPAYILKNVK